MFPPIVKSIEYLFLLREYRDDKITIFVPWGDSYYVTHDELLLYLSKLGIDEIIGSRIADYIWNFMSIYVDVPEGSFVWLSEEDLKRLVRSGSKFMENSSEYQFARAK